MRPRVCRWDFLGAVQCSGLVRYTHICIHHDAWMYDGIKIKIKQNTKKREEKKEIKEPKGWIRVRMRTQHTDEQM